MYPLLPLILLMVALSGCVESKPVTPTEVQMITHVFAKRVVAADLSATQTQQIARGLEAAMTALESTAPVDLVGMLPQFFAPEDADIAELIGTLIQERVDLRAAPELEGKAFIWAVLEGIRGGLK